MIYVVGKNVRDLRDGIREILSGRSERIANLKELQI
jgi:hypothetical protein